MSRSLNVGLVLAIFVISALGQTSFVFDGVKAPRKIVDPALDLVRDDSSRIKKMQVFGEDSGIVFTEAAIFRTDNNGIDWRELTVPLQARETIGDVAFTNEDRGYAVLVDHRSPSVWLARTIDGGVSWDRTRLDAAIHELVREGFADVSIGFRQVEDGTIENLKFVLTSNSNFKRAVYFKTDDDGTTWSAGYSYLINNFDSSYISLRQFWSTAARAFPDKVRIDGDVPDEPEITNSLNGNHYATGPWYLTQDGKCESSKSNCWQSTKLYLDTSREENGVRLVSFKEITPPRIRELMQLTKERAIMAASNSVFSQPPGGTTRISLQRGFDKCTAATSAQMQTWWDNSPFYDVNIYMSGRNRACSQPQLNASWVNTVTQQGWGLIPTVVGYQSPCVASTSQTLQKHSSDPVVAEQQGRGEADIAVTDAINLGLTAGTILYYDMERYDDVSGTGACTTPTKAFLKGWTDRVHELGYQSGVYGSPTNANNDWINIPAQSQMDAVWLARWNSVMSVWGVTPLPDNFWANHQRIHQWLGPRDETWGGVTFNIDNNISDAPVASNLIAKNKRADYDGDGKSDVSVWRPSTGVWYVSHSATPTYLIQTFGIPTDKITPGDYDGDGKTDLAVWRPTDGVWHVYSRSIYTASQFGVAGDVPVAADYDGDGRTDIAVWRPSTGVWYIKNSFDSRGTSFTIQTFGLNGDIPVPDDYDGDGKADIAVYRPSEGVWYLLRSTDGFAAIQFGLSGDYPAQADYDGDGRSDLGIFRPSTGVWYLYRSQDGITSLQFGLTGDIPSVGDFDGDGKYDVAVFRPATGIWYLNRSSAGFSAGQFGVNGDRPVESGYLPPN